MIKPETVLVTSPTISGEFCANFVTGLVTSGGLYGSFLPLLGCSEINLARNVLAKAFLDSPFEWMVCIDADIGFTRADFLLLMSGDDLAVVAEYAKKDGSGNSNQFGMGFVRLHRSVFDKISVLTTGEGIEQTLAVNHFFWQNGIVQEFFPSFADPFHHWSGEDHSFWKLVKMAGITPRVETRTRLIHWGRAGYEYVPKPTELSMDELPDAP